ncbi:pyruvate kinase [Spirochaeta cellobiosiphila]|uniref:pyruvate kinase n=1 Tax=Spirochaeta cellobiosiphila TaxID=504483 RepID=UPI000401535B|nr:pyruvate kinase [Spirochaeta cellobiosiphila]
MKIDFTKRRAKMVCTLGPASSDYETILALGKAGMDVARFNFSHGSYDDHKRNYDIVRKVADDLKHPIAILQDLQGPKIRVQKFEEGQVELVEGARFTLTARDVPGTKDIVSVSHKNLHNDVSVGQSVLLDDGNLRLKVLSIENQDVHCEVVFGGILKNNKGVNLPESIVSIAALTEKDKKDLEFGMSLGVDYVALSFVQKPEDITEIKELISGYGKKTPVIAKIEKPQAVESLDAIIDLTDGVMIARGDLGVEMPTEVVPAIQKEIIRKCNNLGKPVITATQMLESMIYNPRPTRAEAADVANAVLDGSDAVMLSGETAAGKFPVEAAATMGKIISLIESKDIIPLDRRKPKHKGEYSVPLAIGDASSLTAEVVGAKAIVCLTTSGSTAKIISHFRPSKPIIALSNKLETLRSLAVYWGVRGVLVPDFNDNIDHAVQEVIDELKKEGMTKEGDILVVTAGLPFTAKRDTNMLRIETVR